MGAFDIQISVAVWGCEWKGFDIQMSAHVGGL